MLREVEFAARLYLQKISGLGQAIAFLDRGMLAKAKVLPPQLDPVAYRKWVDWLIQNATEAAPQASDALMSEKSWLDDLPELAGWQSEAPREETN